MDIRWLVWRKLRDRPSYSGRWVLASCSPAGSCWVRQWNEPSPQIKSVESRPMTGLPGKHSRRMPSARPEESDWPGARGWHPKYWYAPIHLLRSGIRALPKSVARCCNDLGN